jgi:hypothetical protein
MPVDRLLAFLLLLTMLTSISCSTKNNSPRIPNLRSRKSTVATDSLKFTSTELMPIELSQEQSLEVAFKSLAIDPRVAELKKLKAEDGCLYFVVPSGFNASDSGFHLLQRGSQLLVLSGKGELIRTFGDLVPGKPGYYQSVRLVNLGTKESWVIWSTRQIDDPIFQVESEIFQLPDVTTPKTTIKHYLNDCLHSDAALVTELKEAPFIWFVGPRQKLRNGQSGFDENGKPALSKLVWNNKKGRFDGPASLTYEKIPIFERH